MLSDGIFDVPWQATDYEKFLTRMEIFQGDISR
jgi:hypothetical protein